MRAIIHRLPSLHGTRILYLLAFLLVAVNGVGIWGIFYSGREAREEVLGDLRLQTFAAARRLEAVLSSSRADCFFLSQSPPLAGFRRALSTADPLGQRWSRIDLEATILLFLSSHPEVEAVELFEETGVSFLSAGRRDGAPVVFSVKQERRGEERGSDSWLEGRWPLGSAGSGGWMEVRLSIESLLNLVGSSPDYELVRRPLETVGDDSRSLPGIVMEAVRDPRWEPPVDWTLVRAEGRRGLIDSLSRLTDRFRITLGVNLLLMFLAAGLAFISYRQIRRSTALELVNEQQSRIRELERQLMHNERLVSIGRLAAGMAHEINNPLEGMSNYLSLLEDDLRTGRLDSAEDFIRRIREGVSRAANVTRRALSFAEPGHRPSSRVDLRQVLSETVEFVRGTELFRKINFDVRGLETEIPVRANPSTLSQAFLNLFMNSAEVLDGKGQLEVSAEFVDHSVVVRIADNGPGIPEPTIDRIFEPFSSGKGSTGLGLSICRTIIEQHGGEINGANRPEGGAVFTVRIPLWEADEEPGSGQAPKAVERLNS